VKISTHFHLRTSTSRMQHIHLVCRFVIYPQDRNLRVKRPGSQFVYGYSFDACTSHSNVALSHDISGKGNYYYSVPFLGLHFKFYLTGEPRPNDMDRHEDCIAIHG